ncbi:MAG: hypothetical protein WA609_00400 [Terriglobales bacterium]
MALKIGSWIIGVGCLMAAAGLCFLPAAFGAQRDASLLAAGAMVFSTGMVLAAAGFYIKARFWVAGGQSKVNASTKGRRKVCNLCGENESAVECRVHRMNLCPDCLGKHYDFKSCAYVPSTRPIYTKSKGAGA